MVIIIILLIRHGNWIFHLRLYKFAAIQINNGKVYNHFPFYVIYVKRHIKIIILFKRIVTSSIFLQFNTLKAISLVKLISFQLYLYYTNCKQQCNTLYCFFRKYIHSKMFLTIVILSLLSVCISIFFLWLMFIIPSTKQLFRHSVSVNHLTCSDSVREPQRDCVEIEYLYTSY